jgi:hypothetical protein
MARPPLQSLGHLTAVSVIDVSMVAAQIAVTMVLINVLATRRVPFTITRAARHLQRSRA